MKNVIFLSLVLSSISVLAETEVPRVVSESTIDDIVFDARVRVEGVRLVDGVNELLPIARTNDRRWRVGGLGEEVSATLVATATMPIRSGDALVWVDIAEPETLVTAGGEGVFADWRPTAAYYRLTLVVEDETIATSLVGLTGGKELVCGSIAVDNGNWPAVGKALKVLLLDADGVEQTTLSATWTRYPNGGTPEAGTVVAEGKTQYKPTADDLENWLTVTASLDGVAEPVFTQTLWFSKLPVVYMTTSDGEFPSAAKEDHSGTFRLQGNAEWKKDKVLFDGELEKIHVRGNTTASLPKKPYKIKLGKKADLLGMGKNKHWVLLANWRDVGLMRNKTTYDFSGEFGCSHMASEWVDVVFNGQFVGNYQLCEHIRINETRIDIHNWEDTAEETAGALAKALVPEKGDARDALEDGLVDSMTADLSWLTSGVHTFTNGVTYTLADYGIDVSAFDLSGGYIFEVDTYDDELSKFRVTSGKINNQLIKVTAPETLYSNPDLIAAQAQVWTDFHASVQSENGYANGKSWVERGDVQTMAAYWLTHVLSANTDIDRSRFAYRPQGGPLTFGPAWDFDMAYGGGDEVHTVTTNGAGEVTSVVPYRTTTGWLNGTGYVGESSETENFYPLWVDDPYFCLRLFELWQEKRDYLFGLVAEGGQLDRNYDYLLESGRANDRLWPVQTRGNACDRFDGELGSAKRMKKALKGQIAWIDGEMKSLRGLIASLRSTASDHPYTDSANLLKMTFADAVVRPDSNEGETPDVIVVEGEDVEGQVVAVDGRTASVEVYVNGLAVSTNAVTDGRASYTAPARFFSEAKGRRNLVALLSRDGAGTLLHTTYALVTTADPEHFPLPVAELEVTVGEYVFDPSDPEANPTVEVKAPGGVEVVAGRDYALTFVYRVDGTAEAVVTGLGNAFGSDLAEGQVNLVGEVRKGFAAAFEVVTVAEAVTPVAVDTRVGRPRCPGAYAEILPFAYDVAWWNTAGGIRSVSVAPLENGEIDSAEAVSLPVTNDVGTSLWSPTRGGLYRAVITPDSGDAWTVDIDLTGLADLPEIGEIAPNGDIVFANLRDSADVAGALTLPKAWLDETGVDVEVARNSGLPGANGLPVWQSYVLGFDPNLSSVGAWLAFVQTPDDTFCLKVEGADGVRKDLVDVKYELWSGDSLVKTFDLARAEQSEVMFEAIPVEGSVRFFRAKMKIYWK